MAAWFGGTAEGNPDVAIWAAHKKNGKWGQQLELVREPGVPAYNPVLFFTRDNVLWMYYKFGPSPERWTGGRIASKDGGATWSSREHLPAGLYGPIRNKPLVLEDGTIISGTSVESYGAWACWVERSTDGGKSWTKHGPITVEGTPAAFAGPRSYGIIQPAIVKLPNGKLRMYVRATPQIGRICYSDSTDGGRTWSTARPTSLLNPNSGIDAVTLKDGRILLVYNDTPKGRSPLNVAVSKDGETWNKFLALETEPGEYSYPAVIQASNGTVHITYTWKRQKIRHVELPLDEIPK